MDNSFRKIFDFSFLSLLPPQENKKCPIFRENL